MNIYKDSNHVVIEHVYYDGRDDGLILAPMNSLALDVNDETLLIKSSKNGDVVCAVDMDTLTFDGEPADPTTLYNDFDAIAYAEGSGPGPVPPTPTDDYFTITNLTNNQMNVGVKSGNNSYYRSSTRWVSAFGISSFTADFSLDNGETWSTTTITNSSTFTVPANGVLKIKNGDFDNTNENARENWFFCGAGFSINQDYSISGNLTHVFENHVIMGGAANARIAGMFLSEQHLIDASALTIPTVPTYNGIGTTCGLFNNCNNLLYAPKTLDVSILTPGCYSSMFVNCSKITSGPTINADREYNYYNVRGVFAAMFSGCTSLTTAMDLDFKYIGHSHYDTMYHHCTSLRNVPTITVPTTADTYCFSGTFIENTFEVIDAGDFFNTSFWSSNDTRYNQIFATNNNLKTVKMNITNAGFEYFTEGVYAPFRNTPNVENVELTGSINRSVAIPGWTALTYASIKNILTAAASTTNTDSKTLTFNCSVTDQSSEIADLVAECVSKGWTISGLTIN